MNKNKGNTAQRPRTGCEVGFFAGLYENDAGILAYSKELSRKLMKKPEARRV